MMVPECPQTPATESGATDHRSTQEAPKPSAADEFEQSGMTTSDALKLLLDQAHELKEYVSYYVSVKTDSAKLHLRNTILWMALSALGFFTLCGLLIAAGWFLLSGIAGGLGVLFGGRLWIGNMATGVLASAGLGLGMYYAVAKRMRISRKRTIQKYEERQARQQTEFGHKTCDQAADIGSANK